jgi:hypothetical protein
MIPEEFRSPMIFANGFGIEGMGLGRNDLII